MSGFRLVWSEIAERQYRDQRPEMRALIDRRLGWLVGDPFAEPGTVSATASQPRRRRRRARAGSEKADAEVR